MPMSMAIVYFVRVSLIIAKPQCAG